MKEKVFTLLCEKLLQIYFLSPEKGKILALSRCQKKCFLLDCALAFHLRMIGFQTVPFF